MKDHPLVVSRNLLAVCVVAGLNFVGVTIANPLIPLLANSLGVSTAGIGVVVSSFAVLPLCFAIPAGAITDRIGPRTLIAIGSVGMAGAYFLMGLFPSFIVLILGQALAGLSSLILIVSSQTFVSVLGDKLGHESSFGWFATFASAGQLVGPLVAGPIADRAGYGTALMTAAIVMLLPVLVSRQLPAGVGRSSTERLSGNRSMIQKVLRTPGVQVAMLSSFGIIFAFGARQAFFPLYLKDLGYSVTLIGVLLGLRAFGSMVVRPYMSALVQLAGGRHVALVTSVALVAFGIGVTPALHDPYLLGLSSLIIGIGHGIGQPLSMIAVAENTDDGVRGLAMGVRLTGNRLAQATNPLIFGGLAQLTSIGTAFLFGGVLLTLVAARIWHSPEGLQPPTTDSDEPS